MCAELRKDLRRCARCRKEKKPSDFYPQLDGKKTEFADMCRECVAESLDYRDFDAVNGVLRLLDVPFVPMIWVDAVNKAMRDHKDNAALGNYVRTLNMWQFKEYKWKDSEKLAKIYADRHPEKEGETIMPDAEAHRLGEMGEAEEALYREMSNEDVRYLVAKWGNEYLPSEWLQMEDMYRQYEEEYELNVDRAQTLVFMCKTTVRMNQMLAEGNVSDYQKLAAVLKDLRASGKFTEAQKVEKKRYLDSVGELVAFCEREGGIVPQFDDPDEFPRDKVDFTLRDLKAYTYNLVANEMGLGSIIETYVKKLDAADDDVSLDDVRFVTSGEEADEEYMNDVTAEEWQTYLENGIDDEIDDLLREVRS